MSECCSEQCLDNAHLLSKWPQMTWKGRIGVSPSASIAPTDARHAVTAVYDLTARREVKLHLMYGQPFGAGHSVRNFCRVSEWIARVLQRLYYMAVDHFFDDFRIIEPTFTISSAVSRKLSKSSASSWTQINHGHLLSAVQYWEFFSVHQYFGRSAGWSWRPSPLEERISEKWSKTSRQALAASIVGIFGFLCSTLVGKVGRCCTAPFRHRLCSPSFATTLTPILAQPRGSGIDPNQYCKKNID